ncbi:Receptor-like protein EIX1 [Glycine soja]|uniref:Receptor-like protein EIX1 n=1 Tax=Glycine soja TaxID=3848 RepID=A0A445GK23_GLYSO|nr:Receptor-like protein EIX1 [Glycine soja]
MLSWLWHSSGLRWFVVLVSGGFLGKLRWFPSMTLVWPQRCRRRWLSAGNESRSEEETRRREDFDIEVVIGVGSGGADDWRRIVKEKAVDYDGGNGRTHNTTRRGGTYSRRNKEEKEVLMVSDVVVQQEKKETSMTCSILISDSIILKEIPSQLGNLSNLQKLYLGGSYHGGALKIDDGDHWLPNLISLTHLSISKLNTSHSFLQMIAKLPKLRELSLSYCSLSDHFILSVRPSKFNFSSSLSFLDLSRNSFTSSMILQWLSNVTSNLVELDLSGNLLEGSTSNHFGRVMNSLEHLELSNNIYIQG